MDLPRLAHYTRVWKEHPPIHVTAAHLGRWLGALKPYEPSVAGQPDGQSNDLGELMQHFPVMATPGLDSSGMTPEEIDEAADRMFFGQKVKVGL